MKALLFSFIALASLPGYSFTLNNNFGAAFKSNNVKVTVAGTSACANASITPEELKAYIGPAINDFWNTVPTSALKLKNGGFSDSIPNINTGRLCPPTDADCISQSGGGGVIPPVKGIVISCNNNTQNFSNSGNVLAVTVPNNFSRDKITGAVILINDTPSTIFHTLTRNEQISVIAHEIGHAIGLGHSENKAALMYYSTVDYREKLGQDDVDGVSYLYPVKMDGCGLLGMIDETKTPPFFTTLGALALMILMNELIRLFKRSKTRSSL